tara:strand:+ start:6712 stop:8925 length:2214 start_codon:yes stop_codon:yes gene_type:complete
MATFFDMEMDDPRYGPTKPNKKAIRPKPLKRGTRKKRDKELSDKKKMVSLSHDIFHDLEKKTPLREKSPIEKDQDKVFKVIEKHNKSLKKSPISISGRKSLATIPPRTKLIISSMQDEPTDAQAFAYDNDPTAGMAPWQYHNFMLAKRKHDLRRQRFLQHQQQMRANASDSDDDLAAMSDERRRYQEMKMLARQAKQKETQSGGKRRRKTRKKRGASVVDFDGFEPKFRELLSKIDFATSEEQIRQALVDNIKDFIIYDINNKGKLITGNVKTFSIKESHKTDKWKKEHKTLLSKMKDFGHGSTPSTQIYYQWWRYILKKCKKAIRKRTPIVGYRLQPGRQCEAWGDAGKKLFRMIHIQYIQGSENVDWNNPKTRKFVDGENSIVHQAKVLAFKEMNPSKGGRKTRKKRGGDIALNPIAVNDFRENARVGEYFKFTTQSNRGVIKAFDGRFLGFLWDGRANFRIIKPRGQLYVGLGQFVEILKYVAETDTDKYSLEFIFAEPQQGGRRKKKSRKRKGKGKKYGNLKFREIKTPTPLEPTNIERVYEIDVDAIIKDERKSQQVLNKYNKTVQEWKKTPFYKRKKKNELSDLANQLEFQLRNRQAREMDDSLIQTTNPEKQHYAKLGKDKDGNIIIPKGLIVSSNTKPKSKTRKKGMQVLRMRKAAAAPRRIGGRRSRKKRKKLMCPKNCCGVPVDDCGCPVSCPHCNCPEIKRLRKQLKKTRKKCNKKRKKKTRRRKK